MFKDTATNSKARPFSFQSLEGAGQVLATLQLEVLKLVEALNRMIASERPVM